VDKSEVSKVILDKAVQTTGAILGRINIMKLERAVRANHSIERADVYRTIDGRLCVNVRQRDPIIRLINNNNESYYIDKKGAMMPLSDRYTARVPIATGSISEPYSTRYTINVMWLGNTSQLGNLYVLAKYIRDNEFLSALVEQVYVMPDRSLVIVPMIGPSTVVVGSIDNLDEKFRKLWIMYKKALPYGGWDKYSKIDLQYKNQVVCTRK
jgi:cell division protein FtsQ